MWGWLLAVILAGVLAWQALGAYRDEASVARHVARRRQERKRAGR